MGRVCSTNKGEQEATEPGRKTEAGLRATGWAGTGGINLARDRNSEGQLGRFHKILGTFSVAERLAAVQDGLSCNAVRYRGLLMAPVR
jgi:hypothetical protein